MRLRTKFVAFFVTLGAGLALVFVTTPAPQSLQDGALPPHEEYPAVEEPLHDYLEVVDGCDAYYRGACVFAHTKPDESSPVIPLRTGVVLKVAETIEEAGQSWHRIAFNEWIRYPGRIGTTWYVAATSSIALHKEKDTEDLSLGEIASSSKRILVDRSDQWLSAYDADTLFMETTISTGLALTPTPRGVFTVYRKTPSRYMQGPLPGISDQYYDLPGVPWNLYFTYQGGVIHGAYWHENFGKPWSHGCVNLDPTAAERLYRWADVGTTVIVQD